MITTSLVGFHPLKKTKNRKKSFFFVMRTLRICSLNFHMYDIAELTIVFMLYILVFLKEVYVLLLKLLIIGVPWEAQFVKCLPLAQVMISASWDQAPCWALCPVGSLFLSISITLLVLFLSHLLCLFSQINK